MGTNFSGYSQYYDLLYETKDYNAEVEYIDGLLKKFAPQKSNILELGSGTGKHARLLATKKYSVTGIERSAEMVAIADKNPVENLHIEVGDIRSYLLNARFDIALSLFHVISYLTTNEDLILAFRNVAQHLNRGGLFIFDVWYTPAVYSQSPETRIKRLHNDTINITRLAESVINYRTNVVDVNYEIIIEGRSDNSFSKLNETHPMRHFSEPEIQLLATLTGFECIHSEEFLSGNIPGKDTWGVCFILKKTDS